MQINQSLIWAQNNMLDNTEYTLNVWGIVFIAVIKRKVSVEEKTKTIERIHFTNSRLGMYR